MKKIYIILLACFTAGAASLMFYTSYRISVSGKARPALQSEIASINAATDGIEELNTDIRRQISSIDTELSTKDTVNSYYMEYKKTHDDLTVEIDALKKESQSLDTELENVRSKSGGIEGLSENKKGKTYSLTSEESYTCPEKIPAGRYSAKGSGTFTVLGANGKARVSQNLDVAYDHSYTFNLSERESIRVTGNVTLTELK